MKSFPEQPRLQAAEIAGPAQASIRLWDGPTLGVRPAPDRDRTT